MGLEKEVIVELRARLGKKIGRESVKGRLSCGSGVALPMQAVDRGTP